MKEKVLVAVLSSTMAFSLAIASNYASSSMDLSERYTELFHDLDVDRSNSLSQQEVLSSGLSLESFKRLDVDQDESVSLTEFLVLAEQTENPPAPSSLPTPSE